MPVFRRPPEKAPGQVMEKGPPPRVMRRQACQTPWHRRNSAAFVSAEYAPDPAACREDIEWFARELKAGSFCETVPKNEPS